MYSDNMMFVEEVSRLELTQSTVPALEKPPLDCSLVCTKPILSPDATTTAGLLTGTEVDNPLFRTSRTCLELTAIGSSTGAFKTWKEKKKA